MSNLPAIITEHQNKFLDVMENPEKFERTKNLFISAVNKNPKLASCSPVSLMGCLKKIAQLDIDITSEDMAYLVPYKNEAQVQLSYKALMAIAYNKGAKRIDAQIVYKDDDFDIDLDKGKINIHKPGEKRIEIAGVYGLVELSNGTVLVEYLTHDQIMKAKAKSRGTQFWNAGLEQMSRKTAIKAVLKKIPQSKISYIDAPEVEIGKSEFGLNSSEEIIEIESADIFGNEE